MNTITAKTPFGTLVGRQTHQGAEFLGIEYAEPPIHERRFLPTIRRPRANETVDARQPGFAPPQIFQPTPAWLKSPPPPQTNEACLNLNVYTPGVDDARRPVLVHLFGGGFETGNASSEFQDAATLARLGNCVVVRVSFRIGVLGFLHLGEVWGKPYQAGNLGLLDVCAALEWVHENIRSLGGDPDNVTLFGISSGAFMIAGLFGVPAARGLFHRAWMQSGSASRIIERPVAASLATEFLNYLNITPGDGDRLASVSIEEILQAQSRIVTKDVGERNAPKGRKLGIVDDGETLVSHPLNVFRRGDYQPIPILLGTTRDETHFWFAQGLMRDMSTLDELAQEMNQYVEVNGTARLLPIYQKLYPTANLAKLRERFLTDAIYRIPAVRTCLAHAAQGGHAFAYLFAVSSPLFDGALGASHAFDDSFVWGLNTPAQMALMGDSPQAHRISEEMMNALFQFAVSGNPGWSAYTLEEPLTRVFSLDEGTHLRDIDSAIATAWAGIERR